MSDHPEKPVESHHPTRISGEPCDLAHPDFPGIHCGLRLDDKNEYHVDGQHDHEGGNEKWPGWGHLRPNG